MKSVIQKYYNLETNGKISWCWDGGFYIFFDQQPDGSHKEFHHVRTWKEVEQIFKDKLNEKSQ